MHAFCYDEQNAQGDAAYEDYVEQLSAPGVRFEHYRIDILFQLVVVEEVVPVLIYFGNEFHVSTLCFLIATKLIINQKVLNIGKDKYKFFVIETVTRSCHAFRNGSF